MEEELKTKNKANNLELKKAKSQLNSPTTKLTAGTILLSGPGELNVPISLTMPNSAM